MGNPCQVLVDACRCRSVEIAMRDFLASYHCALLTLDQCSDQLTVLYTLIKTFTEARYISRFHCIQVKSSQVKSTLFRQSGPISHWVVSIGALRKLRLHGKNLKIKNSLSEVNKREIKNYFK